MPYSISTLLTRNLHDVFGENDPSRRRAAVDEIFTEDCVLRLATNMLRERHDVRHAINELNKLLPPEIARTRQAKRLLDHGCVTTMDIVQLIYRPDEPQGYLKDFEFSRPTMKLRWQQGLADAQTTLQVSPWLAPMPGDVGVRVFDVIHDVLTRNDAVAGQPPSVRSSL